MNINQRVVCFKDDNGFMVYQPDSGTVVYTMNRSEASESPVEDWVDLPCFDNETCTLMINEPTL